MPQSTRDAAMSASAALAAAAVVGDEELEKAQLLDEDEVPASKTRTRTNLVVAVVVGFALLAVCGFVSSSAPVSAGTKFGRSASIGLSTNDMAADKDFMLNKDNFKTDTACRADADDKTVDGRNTVKIVKKKTLDGCIEACKEDSDCVGIEFGEKYTRCELWRVPIGVVHNRKYFQCASAIKAEPCDSTDGSGKSSTYPCSCGVATCSDDSGFCNAAKNTCSKESSKAVPTPVPSPTPAPTPASSPISCEPTSPCENCKCPGKDQLKRFIGPKDEQTAEWCRDQCAKTAGCRNYATWPTTGRRNDAYGDCRLYGGMCEYFDDLLPGYRNTLYYLNADCKTSRKTSPSSPISCEPACKNCRCPGKDMLKRFKGPKDEQTAEWCRDQCAKTAGCTNYATWPTTGTRNDAYGDCRLFGGACESFEHLVPGYHNTLYALKADCKL